MTKYSSFSQSSLFDGRELLITASQTTSPESLDKKQICQWLSQHGVILLRNFRFTHSTFTNLVRDCCSRLTIDPSRNTGSGYIQKVNEGSNAVDLHRENGSAPCQPELLFFYCDQIKGTGSATTICDGEKLWQKLNPQTKLKFLKNCLVYRRNVPAECWINYLRHELFNGDTSVDIRFEHFSQLNTGKSALNCELQDNHAVAMEIILWGASPGLFSQQLSFCNSLYGPSKYNQKPDIKFEDGSPLDEAILEEIKEAAASITEAIHWQSGDLVIIDNTRYMHGRRQITSNSREVYVGMGYY